jgi:hypothetical protein
MFTANTQHPLFRDIHNILMKHVGVDRVVNDLIRKLGHVSRAWLTGEMAAGRDSRIIDVILVGENIDRNYLGRLTASAEKVTDRKIRTLSITPEEEQEYLKSEKHALLLWESDDEKRRK